MEFIQAIEAIEIEIAETTLMDKGRAVDFLLDLWGTAPTDARALLETAMSDVKFKSTVTGEWLRDLLTSVKLAALPATATV